MISLNALLGRPVEYYEYPWAMEGRLRDAQSRFRSLFQPSDVGYIFAKSMPRSGHRFLSECLAHYFGPELHYCGFYWPGCCHRIPCKHPNEAAGPTATSCRRATISAFATRTGSTANI